MSRDTLRSIRLLRNIVTSWARYLVQGVTGFVLTPVLVSGLGDGGYGFWVTVFSLTGYFGLFDQGIRPSLIRYISRDRARDDVNGISYTLNSAIALFGGLSLFVLAATLVVSGHAATWFRIPPEHASVAPTVVGIIGLSVALGFPLGAFGAALSGLQRYDIANGIGVSVAVVRALAFVVAIRLGGGLLELAWISLAMNLLGYLLSGIAVQRLVPGLRYGPRWVDREHLGLIGSYGSIAFVGALANNITFNTDAVIISTFLGAAMVTPYAIAAGLVENVRSLIFSASYVLAPTASEMDTLGQGDQLRRVLVNGARYSVLVSWPVLWGLLIFGDRFLATWVGDRLATFGFPLLVVLTLPSFLALPQAPASGVLFGIGRHKGVVALALLNALLNLGLSLLWVRPFGLMGVALGAALPLGLVSGVATMWYASQSLDLPLRRYFSSGVLRPGLVTLAFALPALVVRLVWQPTGWLPLLFAAGGSWLVFVAVAWVYGIGSDDRARWERVLRNMFRRGPGPGAAPAAAVPTTTPASGDTVTPAVGGPPRVSVAITAFNAAWCIERALDSVFVQTRPPDEVVMVDDGSTDGTAELVERRYSGRVRVLRRPHCGVTRSRMAAFDACTGDWIALLDADDIWHPDRLARQLDYLATHPETRWLSSDGRYVSAEGVLRESWLSDYFAEVRELSGDLLPVLARRCFPLVSSAFLDRRAYRAVGGLDPVISYSWDYDLWLRLAARYPGALLPERLVDYWASPGQLSRRYEERHRDDILLMQRMASGALCDDPALRRLGESRVAELEFEVGVYCLRRGQWEEARGAFLRSAARGPWLRRFVAYVVSHAPPGTLRGLSRWGPARRGLESARRKLAAIDMPVPTKDPR